MLIVAAIVLVLSGLILLAFRAVKGSGVRASCAAKMRAVFLAAQLYSNDNPGPDYIELGTATYVPDAHLMARQYLSDSRPFVCPAAIPLIPSHYNQTYMMTFLGTPTEHKGNQNLDDPQFSPPGYRTLNLQLLEKAKEDFPLIYCTVHDELEYQPREGLSGAPWLQWVRRDGSLRTGRAPWGSRMSLIALLTNNFRQSQPATE
ncbi:MAG: hypothetical protein MH204_09720 [Fimbriimonadaceae bacterium]|nr:hypothetical protein [Fimbriimonadaceae bacterium]